MSFSGSARGPRGREASNWIILKQTLALERKVEIAIAELPGGRILAMPEFNTGELILIERGWKRKKIIK